MDHAVSLGSVVRCTSTRGDVATEALVGAFLVVVGQVFSDRVAQVPFTDEDHATGDFPFEAAHESFDVRVAVRSGLISTPVAGRGPP